MSQKSILIYVGGRLITLVLLLAFQIIVVRALSVGEYGQFALVFAIATLMQTVVSFGIPRLIPKLLSEVGLGLTHSRSRRLIRWFLVVRLAGTLAIMVAALIGVRSLGLTDPVGPDLLIVGGIYILIGLVQFDADSMAQTLGLQRVSGACLVFEATVRLVAIALLAWHGRLDSALNVFEVWSVTSGLAAIGLLVAVRRELAQPDRPVTGETPSRREIIAIGLAGYSSSLAWFASSPAVLRLVASQTLSRLHFAGYAFMQGLVLSFQRYTPGSLMLPFLEPALMREYSRTRRTDKLEAALSLMTKADIIFVGAAIVGTLVAGRAIIDLMTDGKYGSAAFALPLLMSYIVTNSIYRSFEIAAITVGASAALLQTFAISLFWLVIAIVLTPTFGLTALLLCPIADALTRLTMVYLSLRRTGIRHFFDLRSNLLISTIAAGCALLGAATIFYLPTTPWVTVAIGSALALAFLASTFLIRPLTPGEAELLLSGRSSRVRSILGRMTAR